MCSSRIRAVAVLVLAIPLGACASTREEISAPPERYGALEPWIAGEIAEVADAGGRLRLVAVGSSVIPAPGSGMDGLLDDPASTWVELRYAKGWAYFDPVEGGEQERLTLREGRSRFAIGQRIVIGRSTERRGGFDRQAVRATGPSGRGGGTELRFRGWIMVRVTSLGDQAEERAR